MAFSNRFLYIMWESSHQYKRNYNYTVMDENTNRSYNAFIYSSNSAAEHPSPNIFSASRFLSIEIELLLLNVSRAICSIHFCRYIQSIHMVQRVEQCIMYIHILGGAINHVAV